MLARQDGLRPSVRNNRYRVWDACLAAERRYGLRVTAPADRTAARQPSRAESEKVARRGLPEPPRVTLRRAVTTAAAGAASEGEFFARLQADGLIARPRYGARNPGRSPGTPSPCPATPPKTAARSGTRGKQLAPDLTGPSSPATGTPTSPSL